MIYPKRKTRTRVFPTAFFQAACDSCVGEAQAGKARLRRHASLWLARLRESSQIAFSLRRRALLRLMRANRRFACRLKWALPIWASPTQESHPLLKNAIGKTRVRVFLFG